jgi:hypothetical protein
MTEIWEYDNLELNDDGHFQGAAYTSEKAGHDVQIGITSCDYESGGETRTNHVPNIVVTDADGSIVAEPHARDSEDPEKALKHAKQTAEGVYENIERYIS